MHAVCLTRHHLGMETDTTDQPSHVLRLLAVAAAERQRDIRHLAARLVAGNATPQQMRAAGIALLQLSGQDHQAEGL